MNEKRTRGRDHLQLSGGAATQSPLLAARQWYAPRWKAFGSLTGRTTTISTGGVPEPPTSRSFCSPPEASSRLQPLRLAMKQTLGELMRMSRICRMVFATCLGSFILVIFYFQSMFQPGRGFYFLPLVRARAIARAWLFVYKDVTGSCLAPPGMPTRRLVRSVQWRTTP